MGADKTSSYARADERALQDPAASIWVEAHAGSGKTYILTERVLLLFLLSPSPAKILCLTYTRAAEGEMRERILSRLRDWQLMDEGQLREALQNLIGKAPNERLLQKARTGFAYILETPEAIRVQTIHAFCMDLLQRFCREAGVLPGFKIADEAETRFARAEAQARLYQKIEADPALGAAADKLLEITEGLSLDSLLLLTQTREALKPFQTMKEKDYQALFARLDEEAASAAKQSDLSPNPAMLDAAKMLGESGSKTDQQKADAMVYFAKDPQTGKDNYIQVFFTQKMELRKRLATKKILETFPELESLFDQETRRIESALQFQHLADLYSGAAAFMRLTEAFALLYQQHKMREGVLDYDDLIQKTGALLKRKHASQWVLYKMDGGLDHLLVDEAQDTTPEQWEVIEALTEEFYAGLRERPKSLFVVGDPKQSIFSFQGASAGKFSEMRTRFSKRAEAAKQNWHEIYLTRSHRSAPEVLAAVDKIFTHSALQSGVVSASPLRHLAHHKKEKGEVVLWAAEKASKAQEESSWRLPWTTESREHPARRLAEKITREIQRLIGAGEAAAEDIMILVPRRGAFSQNMLLFLRKAGIPAMGEARMLLKEHAAVMDLVALARFVLLPEDDLNLAALLKSPLFGLSETALLELAAGRARGKTLWAALQEKGASDKNLEIIEDRLRQNFNFADQRGVFAFFADALFRGGGRANFIRAMGQPVRAVLGQFLELTLDYERQHTPSLQNFLLWLNAAGAEIKKTGSEEGVQLRTIHAAKGLEAKLVFLVMMPPAPPKPPFFYWEEEALPLFVPRGLKPEPEALAQAGGKRAGLAEEENHRLLYVALTRARNQLILCGHETQNDGKPSWIEEIGALIPEQEVPEIESTEIAPAPPLASEEEAQAEAMPSAAVPKPEEAVVFHLTPSAITEGGRRAEKTSLLAVQEQESQRLKGTLVHELLRHAVRMEEEQFTASASNFLKARGVEEEEAAAMLAEVAQVLAHPPAKPLFSEGGLLMEAPVEAVLQNQAGAKFHISARLDLLRPPAADNESVIAVDFKTSPTIPNSPETLSPEIWRQMALYHALLERLWPSHPVQVGVLWTAKPVLMFLPETRLKEEAARILSAPPPARL